MTAMATEARRSATKRNESAPITKVDGAARLESARSAADRRDEKIRWTSPHMLVGLVSAALLALGWSRIEDLDLTPAEGPGYGLGVAGMTGVILLLAYSLRKRVRLLRHLGQLRNWFEAHLILGLLAPVAILYHANFRVESTNAAIALTCMLVVAGSGIGGRFLYGRMHRGLAGELRSVAGMQRAARDLLQPAWGMIEVHPEIVGLITRFETRSAGLTNGLIRALPATTLRIRARALRHGLIRALRRYGRSDAELAIADGAIRACLAELCRAGELRLFTQLFALWHAIHIPLTVILIVSAIVHVVAVHLY